MNFTDRQQRHRLRIFLRILGIKSAEKYPRSPLRMFTLQPLKVHTNGR